jgi:hypothetical protein
MELKEAAHHRCFGGKNVKLLLSNGGVMLVQSSNCLVSTTFFFGAIGPCCEILAPESGVSAKQKRLNEGWFGLFVRTRTIARRQAHAWLPLPLLELLDRHRPALNNLYQSQPTFVDLCGQRKKLETQNNLANM